MEGERVPAPVRRIQLTHQVIDALQAWLSSAQFTVGARLPSETQLMRQFGVGRSTVREAVRALVHTGVLDVRPGDGTYLRAQPWTREPLAERFKKARVWEVYEVRRALEVEIARLAALRRSDHDLERMLAGLERSASHLAAGEEDAYLAADVDFHVAVARATHNDTFVGLYESLEAALHQTIGQAIAVPGVKEGATELHQALFDAIRRQDPDTAQAMARLHLDRLEERFERLLRVPEGE